MKKKLMTLADSVEYMSQERMLQHIVKMLARKDTDYQDAFWTKSLEDEIAVSMLDFEHQNKGRNYAVTVQFVDSGVTEESTCRARTIKSITELTDSMSIEEFADKVVRPVSQELAARVARKLPKPIKETECDVSVRFA